MADQIFIVDPNSQALASTSPVTFGELGIAERRDLEQWIIAQPELLGEEYLVITSEFDHFDKSNRRVDLIALDKLGQLTVIELKLDARGSFADLQAIHYAAFLSNATIEDVVRMLASFAGYGAEEATRQILEFVDSDDLPELEGQPRIVLAAGSLDDEELTSSVLWLRNFGIDLTCVELTPYRLPDTGRVIVVPRVIIPLPEARDFIVGVERKEAAKVQQRKSDVRIAELWNSLRRRFNDLDTGFVPGQARKAQYLQVKPQRGTPERDLLDWSKIHYEWIVRKRALRLDVALHFEFREPERNSAFLRAFEGHEIAIREGLDAEYESGVWGKIGWTQIQFRIPYQLGDPPSQVSAEAAEYMRVLIERTWPILKESEALLKPEL